MLTAVAGSLIPFQPSYRHIAVPLGSGLVFLVDLLIGQDIAPGFLKRFSLSSKAAMLEIRRPMSSVRTNSGAD
jgi:hypothetical protein